MRGSDEGDQRPSWEVATTTLHQAGSRNPESSRPTRRCGGFPINAVTQISGMIDPSTGD